MSEETAGRRAQTSEEGELRQIEAAEMPQLSYRQVQRIYRLWPA